MQTPSAPSPLSSLICDPFVRAAFQRAEQKRDDGHALSVSTRKPRPLDGGAVERVPDPIEDQKARLSPRRLAVAYA